MYFVITTYDQAGMPTATETVDLPTLRERLACAAAAGEHLHVHPHRQSQTRATPEEAGP
ncbi:hypothetical protein LN042_30890 [Kitasatospora sp. RB6PN24]|uniref:hypothetical protein n=1 Tax=Kitasatospora humi TaxID=2893891 RepID=UPI001E640FDB|nr:hypothetical protein [Kitasatospora humi]MCC9311418.1 hypothetical protein [Kitasatospora humi]